MRPDEKKCELLFWPVQSTRWVEKVTKKYMKITTKILFHVADATHLAVHVGWNQLQICQAVLRCLMILGLFLLLYFRYTCWASERGFCLINFVVSRLYILLQKAWQLTQIAGDPDMQSSINHVVVLVVFQPHVSKTRSHLPPASACHFTRTSA